MTMTARSSIGNRKVRHPQGFGVLDKAITKRISTRIRFKNKLKDASKPKPHRPLIDDQGILSEMELAARSLYPGSSAHQIIFLNLLGLTPTSSSSNVEVTDHINKIRDEVMVHQIQPVEAITVTLCRPKTSRKSTNGSARTSGVRSSAAVGVVLNDVDDKQKNFVKTLPKQISDSGYDSASSSPSPPATVINASSSSSSSSSTSASNHNNNYHHNKRRLLYTKGRDGSYKQFCESNLQSQSQTAVKNNEGNAFDVNYLRGIAKHLLLLGTELDFV